MDIKSAAQLWSQLEGKVLDGKYLLEKCLYSGKSSGTFQAKIESDNPEPTVVKVVAADENNLEEQLQLWKKVRQLDHPHLIRIFSAERTELEGTPVIYVVMEQADESLASALQERALTKTEAEQVLDSILASLAYVHAQGLVHTRVTPRNIFAVNDSIKVASDCLQKFDASTAEAGPYAPPELKETGWTTAGDIWSLGVTLFEVLTQRHPGSDTAAETAALPDPFGEIVSRCLEPDPQNRWTLPKIVAALHPEPTHSAPVYSSPEPEPVTQTYSPSLRETPPPVQEQPPGRSLRWLYAALIVLALIGVLYFTRTQTSEQRAPVQPVPESSTKSVLPEQEPTAPKAVESTPAPPPVAPPPSQASQPEKVKPQPSEVPPGSSIWRVVLYTYHRQDDAERKVQSINNKTPEFGAEVFSPQEGGGLYLVVVGGQMNREEAAKLRQKAVSAGFPRDVYAQNFRR